jgi:hypothetical protein
MTHPNDYPFIDEIVRKRLYAIPELMRVLINNAIRKIYLCWQVIRLLQNERYF